MSPTTQFLVSKNHFTLQETRTDLEEKIYKGLEYLPCQKVSKLLKTMARVSKWQNSRCRGDPTGPKWTNLCTKLIIDLTDLTHQDIWQNPYTCNRAKINMQEHTQVNCIDIKGNLPYSNKKHISGSLVPGQRERGCTGLSESAAVMDVFCILIVAMASRICTYQNSPLCALYVGAVNLNKLLLNKIDKEKIQLGKFTWKYFS